MTGLTRIDVDAVAISLGITIAIMLVFASIILVADIRHKEVTMWQLLVLGTVGIAGVMITKVIENLFSIEFILMPIIYIVCIALNTIFNKNKRLGQADVDILSAILAISFPLMIYITTHTCSACYGNLSFLINLSFVAELLFWLLVGCLLDFVYVLVSWLVKKIKKQTKGNFKGQKIPACLIFMPMLFAVVIEAALYLP